MYEHVWPCIHTQHVWTCMDVYTHATCMNMYGRVWPCTHVTCVNMYECAHTSMVCGRVWMCTHVTCMNVYGRVHTRNVYECVWPCAHTYECVHTRNMYERHGDHRDTSPRHVTGRRRAGPSTSSTTQHTRICCGFLFFQITKIQHIIFPNKCQMRIKNTRNRPLNKLYDNSTLKLNTKAIICHFKYHQIN